MNRLLAGTLMGWASLLIGTQDLSAQQAVPAPARVIIVFDASGSMYGQVAGGVKIDIAKKVVSDIIGTIDPAMELGLIAYGHRKKGDCEDIELLVPPQAGSSVAILKAVAGLEPKGKTPLTASVIQAAKHLKFEESKASVILVSDGVETCDKDPCMVATELESLGIDFTCHVIGFDLKAGESSGLECLAKKTGGMYLAAQDASTLKTSLETAMKQVAKPVTTLVVEARKSSGGPMLEGVSFQVFAEGSGENAISSGGGGRWSVELPKAGRYTLSARFGGKGIELEAILKEGETVTKEVVFAETGLKASAYATEGGPAFEKDVYWEILSTAADAEGKREQLAFSYEARPFLKMAPGKYLLKAVRGDASASMDIEVTEGAAQEVKIILGSGNLKLSAASAEGQEPFTKDVAWEILSPADAEGQRKKVTFSYEARPTITLPSGKWLVTVAHGDARGQKEVEVKAGETLDVLVIMGSGRARLAVVMEEGGTPVAKDVAWDILGEADAEGNRKKVAFSYEAQPTLSLAAGKYLVQAQVGNATGTTTIEIEAGKTVERTLVLGAGRLKLSASAAEGGTPIANELSWEILGRPDAEGNRQKMAYSYEAQPTLNLPAGKYIAEVKWGSATLRKDVEVAAGKLVEVPVVLNAGTLAVTAHMGEGADPAATDLAWEILAEPNAEGERKNVGFSYDAQPKFRVTAGKYLISLKRGGTSVTQEVDVPAGKLTSQKVILNAGMLQLSSGTPGGWEIFGPQDAEGNRKQLFYSYDASIKVAVPAGKVLVVRKENDKKAEKELEVKANTLSELTLDAK
ncbi:MAG: vWA domain-containing protein [Prosthecobacter sp.]